MKTKLICSIFAVFLLICSSDIASAQNKLVTANFDDADVPPALANSDFEAVIAVFQVSPWALKEKPVNISFSSSSATMSLALPYNNVWWGGISIPQQTINGYTLKAATEVKQMQASDTSCNLDVIKFEFQ
jgi:hypothetical protein